MRRRAERRKRTGGGRYLRIPLWASLRAWPLAAADASASSVSIEIEKHRPIPVDEPITPEEQHGGAVVDGLLFDGPEAFAPGTILELRIALQPDEAPVTMRGEVVEAKGGDPDPGSYHVKVGFIAGSEAEVDVIAEFVKKFYG